MFNCIHLNSPIRKVLLTGANKNNYFPSETFIDDIEQFLHF